MPGSISDTYKGPKDGRVPAYLDRCTAEFPDKEARVHADAREVHDSQRDGYPGGDLVTYECPHCKRRFEIELPQ